MKRTFRLTILSALLPAFLMLVMVQGCKKTSDSTIPVTPDSDYMLKGSVVNAQTHTGIANATVHIGSNTVVTTDANGMYQVSNKTIGNGTWDVRVIAEGYGFGFASAQVSTDAGMVNTVCLKPLAAAVSVGTAGGAITAGDPESLNMGGEVILAIPAGAFSSATAVSLTRFTGVNVPGYAPANSLNAGTVNIGPASLTFASAEVRFPLPFDGASVSTLPLLKYDFATNGWNATGVMAQVNHANNTAIAVISGPGTYSLGVSGTFTESNGTGETPVTTELSKTESSVNLTYQGLNEYPAGTPASISAAFITNTASQNTRLNGTRVSFSELTTVTFNYIGSKPDSLTGTKSTNTGYYKWVPKVAQATQRMPMSVAVNGVTATGIIYKELFTDACGWQYTHDQGGGGK